MNPNLVFLWFFSDSEFVSVNWLLTCDLSEKINTETKPVLFVLTQDNLEKTPNV